MHRNLTPLWPEENDLKVSIMINFGKIIKTAQKDKINWKTRLTEFLRKYRATPHTTTNQTIFRL